MKQVIALADQIAALRRLDPDHRRKRRRQGSDRALRAQEVQAQGQALHRRQLRRDPGAPARKRIVRPRERRLHRRRRAPHRQVRGSRRRHAAARRNLGNGSAPASETAARAAGARDRPRRRRQAGAGQHPRPRHLEPRSGATLVRARRIPRGSALPPQRRESAHSAAARTQGRSRGAGALLHRQIRHAPTAALPAGSRRTALAQVLAHAWPGNVRELENAMHRAVLLANGEEIGADAIRAPDGAPVGARARRCRRARSKRRKPRRAIWSGAPSRKWSRI